MNCQIARRHWDGVDWAIPRYAPWFETLEERAVSFDSVHMQRAGVFVSLDTDGTLLVERGFVLPEDGAYRKLPATDALLNTSGLVQL